MSTTTATWQFDNVAATRSLSHKSRLALVSHFEASPVSVAHASSDGPCAVGRNEPTLFERLQIEWAKGGEDKKSASASIVIGAILRAAGNPRVFIKLSFGTRRDALYYERLIYCRVTQLLLTEQITPCVVPFIGYVQVNLPYGSCLRTTAPATTTTRRLKMAPIAAAAASAVATPIPSKVCDAIKAMAEKAHTRGRTLDAASLTHGHALITEMSGSSGRTLKEWATERARTFDEWRAVWFQIVYTLECFAQIRLTHWDLHYGNVFIDDLGADVWTQWVVTPSDVRTLHSRWLVKIYDFDRSAKLAAPGVRHFEEPIRNEAMQAPHWVAVYGGQGTWDPRVDYGRLTSAVLNHATIVSLMPADFRRRLRETANRTALEDRHGASLSYNGTLCYLAPGETRSETSLRPCTIDPVRSMDLCFSPAEVLADTSDVSLFGSEVRTLQEATERYKRYAMQPYQVFALPKLRDSRTAYLGRRNASLWVKSGGASERFTAARQRRDCPMSQPVRVPVVPAKRSRRRSQSRSLSRTVPM